MLNRKRKVIYQVFCGLGATWTRAPATPGPGTTRIIRWRAKASSSVRPDRSAPRPALKGGTSGTPRADAVHVRFLPGKCAKKNRPCLMI